MIGREYYGRIKKEKQFRAGLRVLQNYRLCQDPVQGRAGSYSLARLLFTGEQYSSLKRETLYGESYLSPRDLIHSFRDHGSCARKILDQRLGHVVPFLQIL